MTHEENWTLHISEMTNFMLAHRRRPSKYNQEERAMLHWFKYTKKQLRRGELPQERAEQFGQLLRLANMVQRKNQYTNTAVMPDLFPAAG